MPPVKFESDLAVCGDQANPNWDQEYADTVARRMSASALVSQLRSAVQPEKEMPDNFQDYMAMRHTPKKAR